MWGGVTSRAARLGGVLTISVALITISACKGATVTPVPQLKSAAKIDDQFAPIQLDRIVFNFERGQKIGAYRGGGGFSGCSGDGLQPLPIHWRGGRMTVEDAEVSDTLSLELRSAGYNVLGASDQLFESASRDSIEAQYLLGGRVDAIVMDVCDESDARGRSRGIQSGEISVDVTWQIYSLMEREVVLETKSRGSAILKDSIPDGEVELLLRGLAAATANLAADQEFRVALLQDGSDLEPVVTGSGMPPISLRRVTMMEGSIHQNMKRIQASVVTLHSGRSLGSGFFVAPDLILTNEHVVRGAARVKVALIEGGTVYAKVLRRDAKRDVALLQVETGTYPALPLRTDKPGLAEEVYAIGSPLDASLAGTVTKGIVSQFKRNREGLDVIQADVTIHPGNSGGPLLDAQGQVVGISQSGLTDRADNSMGINFFIPIADALKHLNLVRQ